MFAVMWYFAVGICLFYPDNTCQISTESHMFCDKRHVSLCLSVLCASSSHGYKWTEICPAALRCPLAVSMLAQTEQLLSHMTFCTVETTRTERGQQSSWARSTKQNKMWTQIVSMFGWTNNTAPLKEWENITGCAVYEHLPVLAGRLWASSWSERAEQSHIHVPGEPVPSWGQDPDEETAPSSSSSLQKGWGAHIHKKQHSV